MSLESKIRMWEDNNEHFLGEELDEEKMEKLTQLREIGVKISEQDKTIVYKAFPFSNRSRNAIVMIDIPEAFFEEDKTVLLLLAKALVYSDNLIVTALSSGAVRLTFCIRDMWLKWGYDNDMEHGD